MTTHPDALFAIERQRSQERRDAVSRRRAARPLSRTSWASRLLVPSTGSAIVTRVSRGTRPVGEAGEAA